MSVVKKRHVSRYAAITLLGMATAFPLIYLLSGSLMTRSEIGAYPPKFLAAAPQWENYAAAIDFLTPRAVTNTAIFVIGVVVGQLVVCLPAGFALAKIPFRGARSVFLLFLVPIFMPTNLMLIPTFLVVLQLGMYGTFLGMILPIVGQASLAVILFRAFFASLPDGLLDAARLDGASWWQTFFRIALPLSRPIVASYTVVTFLTAWNMFMWPLIAGGGTKDTAVLTVALAPLGASEYSTLSPSVGFAAAVISVIPVLTVFLLFQKWFARGIVGTGVDS